MLVFDPTDHCSSSIWCFPQRIFGRSDSAILMEETAKILLKTISTKEVDDWSGVEKTGTGAENFNDLVHDMMSNGQDIKYFAFMTKDVITKMEHMVRKAKLRESLNWYLAARGVPKSLHCLTLELADEYSTNAEARSNLIHPQHMYRLIDHSFHHLVLLTDNVLAASVVVSSVVNASANPEKLVFHVVTDKITYASMHAWFAMNAFAIGSAVVEVKGLHQYDWTRGINTSMKQLLEIHHQICRVEYQTLRREDLSVLTPSCNSFLNVLRMYLPELFQDLNKVVLLDDDVIVQHDLSSLWDLDLDHKVMGAVVDSNGHHECCSCHKYSDYFNFTDSIISSNVDPDTCGWLFGVNVLDLKRWRQTNITASYLHWLERNLNAGFMLWRYPGVLPPALLAFENQVHHIKSSWQLSKMGEPRTGLDKHKAEAAAVLHFSGPAKPWLEMAPTEVQGLWYKHVNFSNEHIRRCGVSGSL